MNCLIPLIPPELEYVIYVIVGILLSYIAIFACVMVLIRVITQYIFGVDLDKHDQLFTVAIGFSTIISIPLTIIWRRIPSMTVKWVTMLIIIGVYYFGTQLLR